MNDTLEFILVSLGFCLFGYGLLRFSRWQTASQTRALVSFASSLNRQSPFGRGEFKSWDYAPDPILERRPFVGFYGEADGKPFTYSLVWSKRHGGSTNSPSILRGTFCTPSDFASFRFSRSRTIDTAERKLSNGWIRTYSERPLTTEEESILAKIAESEAFREDRFSYEFEEYAVEPAAYVEAHEAPPEWAGQKCFVARVDHRPMLVPIAVFTPNATHMSETISHIERAISAWKNLEAQTEQKL